MPSYPQDCCRCGIQHEQWLGYRKRPQVSLFPMARWEAAKKKNASVDWPAPANGVGQSRVGHAMAEEDEGKRFPSADRLSTLAAGLDRSVDRVWFHPLAMTCWGGVSGGRRRIGGIAPLRTRRLPIDPDARARRNLVGRLSESRAAGQQGQDSSDRKDSTDFHCDVPSF